MDFNELNCFISVAETLNFSEAARQNFVSQSTVSRYISELEKEFGVKLFVRSRRDVALTNEGKALLPYALELTKTLEKAKSVISRMHQGGMGKLSVTFDAVSGAFAGRCLSEFSKRYPDIAVDITEISGRENARAFADAAYDFHFMLRDMLPEGEETEALVTHSCPLKLILSKNFTIRNKTLQALQNERFLLLSESVNPILYMEIMDIFRTCHLSPDICCYDSVKALMVAAGAGLGIAVLPGELTEIQMSNRVKPAEIEGLDTSLVYAVAYRKEISNPAARLFLNIVKELATGGGEEYEL